METFYQLLSTFVTMNEFNVSTESSGDELIHSTFGLLEKSQDLVNKTPVSCDRFKTFSNQLINYLLTGYPFRTEICCVRSVLCEFRLSIFLYGPGNQLTHR